MIFSALLENVFSILMAPVLMMFHTIFVLFTVLGVQIKWNPQNRADVGLTFWHCLKLYGWLTVLGAVIWPVAVSYLGGAGWWLAPIFSGWILAPFLAWLTSGKGFGNFLIKCRLFVTPEEVTTPPELQGLNEDEAEDNKPSPLWVQALLSPYVQAVHLALVRQGSSGKDETPAAFARRLAREAGPRRPAVDSREGRRATALARRDRLLAAPGTLDATEGTAPLELDRSSVRGRTQPITLGLSDGEVKVAIDLPAFPNFIWERTC
jgi:membrane glycosyltransferase